MVAELEGLFQNAATSPEAMWRSRILQGSADEARRDLSGRVRQVLREMQNAGRHHRSQYAAQQKLQRDWNRAQGHLEAVLQAYHRRQVAELSMLSTPTKPNGQYSSHPMLQEEKEDFFDRAMRERHEEVKRISQSMNKINHIYTVRSCGTKWW
jgi:predicted lipid-binding transport protein (Tim44 family)